MADFKKEYQEEENFWGDEYNKGLEEAVKWTIGRSALDVGAGERQNSIYLAQNGFDVLVLDCSF